MRWRRLVEAPFGVELLDDVRLAKANDLVSLLAEHQLIVVRAELTDDEHVGVISKFGRVLPQGPRVLVDDRAVHDDGPVITQVSNEVGVTGLGDFELLFHHDMAHTPTPYSGLSLYSLDVAPGQSPTRFASGISASERLSDAQRRRLAQLQGLFIGNYTTISDRSVAARQARPLIEPNWPHAVHPLLVTHPHNDRPCLFVNEMQTVAVLALDLVDSDALLDSLFALLYDAENVYEHEWRPHELVIWDNIALQHARPVITSPSPRVLRRVVWGERAPWEAWPAAPSGNRPSAF